MYRSDRIRNKAARRETVSDEGIADLMKYVSRRSVRRSEDESDPET